MTYWAFAESSPQATTAAVTAKQLAIWLESFMALRSKVGLIGGSLPSMHLPSLGCTDSSATCLTSSCDAAHRV